MARKETNTADAEVLSLKQLVEFARRHSSYYARLYQQIPQTGWQLCDLPLVDPRDYWEGSSELTHWPVLTGPVTDGIVFKTGGTTGASKLSVYTRSEWRAFVTSFGRSLANQLHPGDRVANLFFAGDLYSSFLFIHGKRKATAACDSGPGIVRLELLLNQMELYSWKALPTGELNHARSIPTTSNFESLNWLLTPMPTSQK